MSERIPTNDCPACGQTGRKIGAITPQSLLTEAALEHRTDVPVRFCRTADCDVVYFDGAQTQLFRTDDLKVTVFQKSQDLDRLVCYCFDHSVRALQEEVRLTGGSMAPETIAALCRAGEDACDRNNLQGACCLGNVRQVIKSAPATGAVTLPAPKATGCCCSKVEA